MSIYQTLQDQVIQSLDYAETGNTQGMLYLAQQGVDLNKGDYDRRTPMHIAARFNQV